MNSIFSLSENREFRVEGGEGSVDDRAELVVREVADGDGPPSGPAGDLYVVVEIALNGEDGVTKELENAVTISFVYNESDLSAVDGDPSRFVLLRADDANDQWERLETTVLAAEGRVFTTVGGFSFFALAIAEAGTSILEERPTIEEPIRGGPFR